MIHSSIILLTEDGERRNCEFRVVEASISCFAMTCSIRMRMCTVLHYCMCIYVLCVRMQKSVHVCVLCCNLWLPFCVQYVLCMHVFCVVLAGCAFICAFFAAYSCVSALSVGICAQGNRVMCSRVTCRTKIDRLSKLTKSIEYIIGIWTYNSEWQVFEAPLENLLRMFFYISIHIIFPASK